MCFIPFMSQIFGLVKNLRYLYKINQASKRTMSSTYEIKMLYESIARLTKENIELKQENKMLEGLNNEWCHSNHIYEQQEQKLEKEIKELKEEIKELKEENDKFTYTPTTKKI